MKKKSREAKNHSQVNINKTIFDADLIPYEKVYVYNEQRKILNYCTFPHILEQSICYADKNRICITSRKTKYNLKDQLESLKVSDEEKEQVIKTAISTVIELEKIGVWNADLKPSNILYSTKGKVFLADYLNSELLSTNNTQKAGRVMLGLFIHTILENIPELFNYLSVYKYVTLSNISNVTLKEEYKKYESVINGLLGNKMIYEEVRMELDLDNSDNQSIYKSNRLVELLKYNDYYYTCHHPLNKRTKRIIDNALSRVERECEIVLRDMNLHDISFYYNELEYLCDNFYFFSNIKRLDISNNEIDDNGLIYVCNSFRYIPLLESFDSSANNITRIGFDSFCNNIHLVTRLKYLYFSKCVLTDYCVKQLIKNIYHCPLLIEVSLYGNKIVKKQELCNEMVENHPNKHLRVIMYQL